MYNPTQSSALKNHLIKQSGIPPPTNPRFYQVQYFIKCEKKLRSLHPFMLLDYTDKVTKKTHNDE